MPDYEKILWSRIDKTPDGCWIWTGPTNGRGYGIITIHQPEKKTIRVHRLTYTLLVGPIPPDRELDHTCKNRLCCNPEHLDPVLHQENMLRTDTAQKTHCKHGHEFTPENMKPSQKGHRICRECARIRQRAHLRQKREAATPAPAKTTCPRGHPYQENRVVLGRTSYCRICNQEKARRYHRIKVGIPLDVPVQRQAPNAQTCIHGHELTEENTYIRPSGGARICRICKREQLRDWRRHRVS